MGIISGWQYNRSMSSPIEGGFQNLSLKSPMSLEQRQTERKKVERDTTTTEIHNRKIAIRDIISAFSGDHLPSEISPDAFESINIAQRDRAPSEWTRTGDLNGSLMVWCSHDDVFFGKMARLETPERRAIFFWQKLSRRLQEEFKKYDKPESEEDIVPDVGQIANNFRVLEAAFREDLDERPIYAEITSWSNDLQAAFTDLHQAFVDALQGVYERPSAISSHARYETRHSSGAQGPVSLYHSLIESPPAMQEPFMIGLLEQTAVEHPRVLSSFRNDLEKVLSRLEELEAPADYRHRLSAVLESIPVKTPSSTAGSTFRRIEPKPDDDNDDDDDDDAAGPATRPRPSGQIDPPTGTKRPATQAPGRRGRQKRGIK